MDKFDEWLNQKTAQPVVKLEAVTTELKPYKPPFDWIKVGLFLSLLLCGYLLFTKNDVPGPDPEPEKNVVKFIEENTKLFPYNLSLGFTELKKQVDNKEVNNGKELLANAKALSQEAIVKSLGNINQLDKDNIPDADKETGQWTDENRVKVSKYLSQKIEGHLKASK